MSRSMIPKLTPSMEDYLEAIHLLIGKQGYVRVKDIAAQLKISMPSVSGAIKILEKLGFTIHERYDRVGLTAEGSRRAREIYRRHHVLKTFFCQVLGIDPEIAEKDACAMEHSISPETLKSLARFVESESGLK